MVSTLEAALSVPRLGTYINACVGTSANPLDLYGWNARISSALMLPAHFSEIAVRNAVSDALTHTYGDRWPWSEAFKTSLPNPGGAAYSPRRDLERTRDRQSTTGKVVAELKFAFWEHMFTRRHKTLWDQQIRHHFPHCSPAAATDTLREGIRQNLESIRKLRNRIAHHEPIFAYPIAATFNSMIDVTNQRCQSTGAWLLAMQDVTSVLGEKP